MQDVFLYEAGGWVRRGACHCNEDINLVLLIYGSELHHIFMPLLIWFDQ